MYFEILYSNILFQMEIIIFGNFQFVFGLDEQKDFKLFVGLVFEDMGYSYDL